MRVDLITISYCSLPVYLKSFDSRKTCVIDIDNNDISGQRHCCVCLDNACHCLESCRAVWRSAEVRSACLRPSSVATVSEDTTCRHTNAYSNPLHGAVICVPCHRWVASTLFPALPVCSDMVYANFSGIFCGRSPVEHFPRNHLGKPRRALILKSYTIKYYTKLRYTMIFIS